MINELIRVEALQNEGRGVCCVKSIITFLQKGRNEYALNMFIHDHDKILNYPELIKILVPMLKVPLNYLYQNERKWFNEKGDLK